MTKIHTEIFVELSKVPPKKLLLFANDVPCPKCRSIKISVFGGGCSDGFNHEFELICQECNHSWKHTIV